MVLSLCGGGDQIRHLLNFQGFNLKYKYFACAGDLTWLVSVKLESPHKMAAENATKLIHVIKFTTVNKKVIKLYNRHESREKLLTENKLDLSTMIW